MGHVKDLAIRLGGVDVNRETEWHQQDGVGIKVRDMDTRHCFHSLKILHNFIARHTDRDEVIVEEGSQWRWHFRKMKPYQIALWMMAFVAEIDARDDLADEYVEAYTDIRLSLLDINLLQESKDVIESDYDRFGDLDVHWDAHE